MACTVTWNKTDPSRRELRLVRMFTPGQSGLSGAPRLSLPWNGIFSFHCALANVRFSQLPASGVMERSCKSTSRLIKSVIVVWPGEVFLGCDDSVRCGQSRWKGWMRWTELRRGSLQGLSFCKVIGRIWIGSVLRHYRLTDELGKFQPSLISTPLRILIEYSIVYSNG